MPQSAKKYENMKKYFLLFVCIFLFACTSAEERAARAAKEEARFTEYRRLINSGQCSAAEKMVSEDFSGNEELFVLAEFSMLCRKDRKRKINYLIVAARDGYKPAIKALIEEGVTPPALTRKKVTKIYNNSTTYKRSTGTASYRNTNMNKCIRDGGSLICYNRNAKNRSGMITPGTTPYGN